MFNSIDRDRDNRLDKTELQAAFQKAGLVVPRAKLNQFFAEVDENHDVSYTLCIIYLFCANIGRAISHLTSGGTFTLILMIHIETEMPFF